MTTRVYLIRHGSTQLSSEDRFSGATDVSLSDEGRWQAEHLSARLANDNISAFYCSPMIRTIQTARIIALPHNMEPIPMEQLREINHGHWEKMLRSEVEVQFPDEYAAWQTDPFTFAPDGGESGLSVMARALPALREIIVRHLDQNVAVISHKATIRLMISSLLGFDARGYRDRLDQSPACLNLLDFKDPVRARLTLFNDVSHYSNEPPYPSRHLSKWWDSITADNTEKADGKSN